MPTPSLQPGEAEETNPRALYHHRIAMYGPLCEHCGKPLRTPAAKLCAACWQPVREPGQKFVDRVMPRVWITFQALQRDRDRG